MPTMSFGFQIKTEICRNRPFRLRFQKALAYGLLLFGKSFNADAIVIHTEHRGIARMYADSITDLVGLSASITTREVKREDGRSIYALTVDSAEDRLRILDFFGHAAYAVQQIRMDNLSGQGEAGAFVSGAYLACGNCSDPQKGYHAEFAVVDESLSESLCALLSEVISLPKRTVRRGRHILYYKESEQIEELLTFISASKATLAMMEVKMVKELRNKVNRVTNCETANITKTVTAGLQQAMDIQLILDARGEESLSDDLRELALLRLENPDMSLRELSEALGVSMSRSGINHRLKRLADMAAQIRETEG